MREAAIEAKLADLVRARGGSCYKFISPGNPGVPDRIVITPGGRIVFVELKSESGRLSPVQRRQCSRLRELRADVRVLKGLDQVQAFVREVFPT